MSTNIQMLKRGVGVGVLLALLVIIITPAVAQSSPDELKETIEAKAKELEAVSAQIKETNESISKLQGQSRTLANEVKRFDYIISQVNLGIKSSEITIDKLGLELQSLDIRLSDIAGSISSKREAIGRTLRELQKKDNEGTLHMLLKNASIVEGAFEIQALRDLQDTLSFTVNDLESLQEGLTETLTETSQKKSAIETENSTLRNRQLILGDQKQAKSQTLSQVKNQESLYQKQLSELEKQQDAISAQIADIEEELRLKFDASLLPRKRPGVFEWPIKLRSEGGSGVITQHFGEKSYLYRGRAHNGLDIGAPTGTPIYAAEDGVVIAVDYNGLKYQYGRYVLIKHLNNMTTLYAHLSRQATTVGASVKRGEVIGYVGSTGYSTGPHLHFGVYWSPSVVFKSIYPASGLVPIGIVIDAEDYL